MVQEEWELVENLIRLHWWQETEIDIGYRMASLVPHSSLQSRCLQAGFGSLFEKIFFSFFFSFWKPGSLHLSIWQGGEEEEGGHVIDLADH